MRTDEGGNLVTNGDCTGLSPCGQPALFGTGMIVVIILILLLVICFVINCILYRRRRGTKEVDGGKISPEA